MTSRINSRMSRLVVAAGLALLVVGGAHAARGYTVTETNEHKVVVGMTADQVRDTLGPPGRIQKFRNFSGLTWTYEVINDPFGFAEFDINFGPDDKVVSSAERVLGWD